MDEGDGSDTELVSGYVLPEGYSISKHLMFGDGDDIYFELKLWQSMWSDYSHEHVKSGPFLGKERKVRDLSELSIAVGELIAEAIAHKAVDDRAEEFERAVEQWSQDTGIQFIY